MITRLLALALLGGTVSCAQKSSPSLANQSVSPLGQPSTSTVAAPTSGGSRASDIANREIIRRQEMLRRADETALRASQAMANGDLEGAVSGYRSASQAVR
jgi:hypothetical protein